MKVIGLIRAESYQDNIPILKLKQQYPDRLNIIPGVNLEEQPSIENAFRNIAALTDSVDLLLNVAGILGDASTTPGPERTIDSITRDWLEKSLRINVIGHVMMTKSLMPMLRRKSSGDQSFSKVVNISARVGSITDNRFVITSLAHRIPQLLLHRLGGWYSYRMSKTALNMFTKTLSIESKR
jgi:NAD(P)-dependent dehydrogenase (short-subunit alcohol dehydrogenase family)